ncbi:unnamed protein product [Fusarium fujikuroi]|uniref:Uncharacterized protein n=1 Tax=Fusarium fujikuroi TaxID=5127 RepID=A0A9Q9RNK9_FUSFU|nr:unnamed protein product [Fusarium fujikuroi]VTT79783.1 unnamed protein product [Fusarium fujikuroi]
MTGTQAFGSPDGDEYSTDSVDLHGEIDRLSVMLSATELHSMDWVETITCAPKAIGIIGECLVMSSHQRAASIELTDSRLKAPSLPANLRQCAITGKGAFDEAASRMRNISSQALILARDGSGVIDRITKFACKDQTPVVARELEKQKANLKRVVVQCTQDAEALQGAFQRWNEETRILLEALNIKEDQVHKKVEVAATRLINTELDLERLKTELGYDGMNLAEIQDRLLERTEVSQATSAVGTPAVMAGLLLQSLGASIGGPLILGASLAIWGTTIFAASTQMDRDAQLKALQTKSLKAQTLDQQIQKLGSASCTLKEMKEIVSKAVRQILDLQFQVGTLLDFFKAIFKRVESMDQFETMELERLVTDQGYKEDEDIKMIMVQTALDLKVSFTFVGRLAEMYSKVSVKYLLPGMQTVQMLGLSDDSVTPAQLEWKARELAAFKTDSVENVRRLTMEVSIPRSHSPNPELIVLATRAA